MYRLKSTNQYPRAYICKLGEIIKKNLLLIRLREYDFFTSSTKLKKVLVLKN